MAVPATDSTGDEEGTPPGGATGSIADTLPATDGRSQSANGGTSLHRSDRLSQPENDAPPNGGARVAQAGLSGRSGAFRQPVGAPAQPRLSGSPITRRYLPKVPGHATNLRGPGGSAGCQRADRTDLRGAGPAGRDDRAAPPAAGSRRPPFSQASAGAGDCGRGDRARGDHRRRDPAARRHPGRPRPRRRAGRRGSAQLPTATPAPPRRSPRPTRRPRPPDDRGDGGPTTRALRRRRREAGPPRPVGRTRASRPPPTQGWKLVDRDEFTGSRSATKWGRVRRRGQRRQGPPHPGRDLRWATASPTIRGDADGNTGGMSWRDDREDRPVGDAREVPEGRRPVPPRPAAVARRRRVGRRRGRLRRDDERVGLRVVLPPPRLG